MKAFVLAVAVAAILGLAATPVRADQVVYEFAALRGDLAQCVWFDENLNDRSEGALVHQVDLIYNRTALPAGAPVTVTNSATTKDGTQLVELNLNRTKLCTGAEAVHPPPIPPAQPALPQ